MIFHHSPYKILVECQVQAMELDTSLLILLVQTTEYSRLLGTYVVF